MGYWGIGVLGYGIASLAFKLAVWCDEKERDLKQIV
jgi:hypothetical protein